MHVTIIGGGISGLATAWYLEQAARRSDLPLAYTLVEASDHLGGKLQTRHEDAFLLEAGPDSFVSYKPAATTLCHALGLEEDLLPCQQAAAGVSILRRGKLLPMPHGFRLAVPTRFWPFVRSPLLSLSGKLRVGMEPLVRRSVSVDDESLGGFIRRRLGKEMLESIAGPLMSGIYGLPPDELSLASTFPKLAKMEQEHGSLLRGILKQGAKATSGGADKSAPRPMFLSLRNGMGSLVDALTSRLTGELRTDFFVTRLEPRLGGGYTVSGSADADAVFQTDHVISTLPAPAAGRVLAGVDAGLSTALSAFKGSHTISVYCAFPKAVLPEALQGFGFIVPAREKRAIRSCTICSNKFPGRAPAETALLRLYLSFPEQEQHIYSPDETILALVRSELAELLGIEAEPLFARVFRKPGACPQYRVGHPQAVAAVEALVQAIPDLDVIGASFRGMGVPDVIAGAEACATRVHERMVASRLSAPCPT